jgi:hypothetical protein
MLDKGLRLLRIEADEQGRRLEKTNMEDFASQFGSTPAIVTKIWTLLNTVPATDPLQPGKHYASDFLLALNWLKIYPTERDRKITMKVGEKTGRKWSWFYSEKIAGLKEHVIKWPANWGNQVFTVSVDGVHFRIQEPQHPEFKRDKKYFSHKFGRAGLDYKITISIYDNRGVVWVNGPFNAAKHDVKIFSEGLQQCWFTAL